MRDFDVDAQDGLGWTPLMMAASLKDADEVVDLLLSRDAGVNVKSTWPGLESPYWNLQTVLN